MLRSRTSVSGSLFRQAGRAAQASGWHRRDTRLAGARLGGRVLPDGKQPSPSDPVFLKCRVAGQLRFIREASRWPAGVRPADAGRPQTDPREIRGKSGQRPAPTTVLPGRAVIGSQAPEPCAPQTNNDAGHRWAIWPVRTRPLSASRAAPGRRSAAQWPSAGRVPKLTMRVGAYSGGGHSTPTMRISPHHVSRATFQPSPTRTA
jgi:hypothetical protein